MDTQGKESALKVYSLLDQQNLPVLVSGRLPQNVQECVVDAQAFGKDAVGTMLTLSENNEEDTEELFAHKQFHVVGTVNSLTMQIMSAEPPRWATELSAGSCWC